MSAGEEQVALILELISQESQTVDPASGTAGWLQRLCRAAARALPASGAAVSVMSEAGGMGVAVGSEPRAEVVEELQFALGEGPCLDAYETGRPVLALDLADGDRGRWPGYATAACEHGVRAVFAFPLQVGAVRLGAFGVHRDMPGALSQNAFSQALTFAQVATSTVLDGQGRAGAGEVAAGLDDARVSHFEVHQAQGMVMVQLGVSLAEALARMRAYAFANEQRLADVAGRIVRRELVLPRDHDRRPDARGEGSQR